MGTKALPNFLSLSLALVAVSLLGACSSDEPAPAAQATSSSTYRCQYIENDDTCYCHDQFTPGQATEISPSECRSACCFTDDKFKDCTCKGVKRDFNCPKTLPPVDSCSTNHYK
jgi:major membrane immunogen (membrane-anchored lipoprotein)